MVAKVAAKGSVSVLREELRAAGLRATGPRLSVLRAMQEVRGPSSHAEIATLLGGEGLDRATVYRNLIDLTEAGLLVRTDHGDHTWRFELRGRETEHAEPDVHPHFLCDACGDVTCLPDEAVQVVAAKGAPRALSARRYEVQIKGRCDRCA